MTWKFAWLGSVCWLYLLSVVHVALSKHMPWCVFTYYSHVLLSYRLVCLGFD